MFVIRSQAYHERHNQLRLLKTIMNNYRLNDVDGFHVRDRHHESLASSFRWSSK